MKKNDLLRVDDRLLRLLDIRDDAVLVIDCVKRTMPKWIAMNELKGYVQCEEATLWDIIGRTVCDIDSVDAACKRQAYERFTMISGVLPFVGDEKQRTVMIDRVSAYYKVSKQTIRRYLCQYLTFQSVAALAPKSKDEEKVLTVDEKNMRWALNRFYYTPKKNSLTTAYTLMLKERYCDGNGVLLKKYPSIHQFRYFYRKNRKMQNFYISRNGLQHYQRNSRPLLGDGVREFAPHIGIGMLDSTVCDIYLVNEAGEVIGRPILTACVDAYSGLCCGYALTWEGGVYSLKQLMLNVVADKVEWCSRFGISITASDWDCQQLPSIMVTDMGAEYKSELFSQIAELGVRLVHLPPYRPELKSVVEKFFDVVQSAYKRHLKGKGVVEPDFNERGGHDYRRDAVLTMADFEKILLHTIHYYNANRVLESFPYTEAMLKAEVQPFASSIWNWGRMQCPDSLLPVSRERLQLTLLPRTQGKFTRSGLRVNKLRYKCDGYTEQYLTGGDVVVAYDPSNVSRVWLVEKGEFVHFELIDSRFDGMCFEEVHSMMDTQRKLIHHAAENGIQAKVDLAAHIEAIVSCKDRTGNPELRNIRKTRRVEQSRRRIELVEGEG